MELRYYQKDAIDALAEFIGKDTRNPCIEIPTGGGKTPVIATLTGELVASGYRVLILAHRKELLEQTAEKMAVWAPDVKFGILSAGLRKKEFEGQALIAGIQSAYKYGTRISAFGSIDFVIVDECHLIPPEHERKGGMYQTLFSDLKSCNPDLTVIGFTATPYRLASGPVCSPDGFLNEIIYSVSVKELIDQGFLSPLVTKIPDFNADFAEMRVEKGEFKDEDVDAVYAAPANVQKAVAEMLTFCAARKSVLIFVNTVKVGKAVLAEIRSRTGEHAEAVFGSTPGVLRDKLIARFRSADPKAEDLFGGTATPLKYLVNCGVLTTGFDAANVDAVVLFRPTMSPGLYYQMVGRGFRICPGKTDCLVLDYGGNIQRHGPVDAIKPEKKAKKDGAAEKKPKVKKCPKCSTAVAAADLECPVCGYTWKDESNFFPCPECQELNEPKNSFCWNCGHRFPVESNVEEHAERSAPILSGGGTAQAIFTEPVLETRCWLHRKKNDPDAPPMVWIQYRTESDVKVSEFLHFDKPGGSWGRRRAEEWWEKRCAIRAPRTAAEAVYHINRGAASRALEIRYRPKTQKNPWPELVEVSACTPVPEDYLPGVFLPPCECGAVECLYYYDAEMDVYATLCASCKSLRHTMTPADYEMRRAGLDRLGVVFRTPTREELEELHQDEF